MVSVVAKSVILFSTIQIARYQNIMVFTVIVEIFLTKRSLQQHLVPSVCRAGTTQFPYEIIILIIIIVLIIKIIIGHLEESTC